MKTILNNYTIDDFLKLKPIIYEYCCNLTQKKNSTTWYRDFAAADDLYQDLYIKAHTTYFNKPKEPIVYERFVQRMKNLTFYTHTNNFYKKGAKLINKTNHFQDTFKSEFLFESTHFEEPLYFENIQDHPDYAFYMKNLKFNERLAIQYFLNGYTKTEVAKKFNKTYPFIPNIVKKIESNMLADKFSKSIVKPSVKKIIRDKIEIDDISFLKSKISNFDIIFKNDKFVKLYSLYLQGFDHKIIAKKLDKSVSQVNVEIYRINKKIKQDDSTK